MTESREIKEAMKAFYASEAQDRAAAAWIEAGGTARIPESKASHYFLDRKVAEALALASLPREARVLEVGCSFGHQTFLLTERFREVVAVDLSPESIDLARRRAARYGVRNVRFEVADAEQLDAFADGSFDGVLAFSTLRFCPNPGRAVAEMMRVTRPGGAAVLDVPNRDCPWYGPMKRGLGIDPHIHDRLYTKAEIEGLLAETGLEGVRSKHILFTTKRVPDALLPVFQAADWVLERLPGVRSMSGIIMAAGRKGAGG